MKLILICFVIQFISIAYGTYFEKYKIIKGKPTTNGIRCFLKAMSNTLVAVMVSDTNGDCVVLTDSWLTNSTYITGYTYIVKDPDEENVRVVFEEFTLTNAIGEPNPFTPTKRVWTIPGIFGVGGRLELYFTTPLEDWNSFRIRIYNTTAEAPFDLYDELGELLLLSVRFILADGTVEFKTFDENGDWHGPPNWTSFPFEKEHTYKMTIVAQQNNYQISFDGTWNTTLQYIAPPEVAKTMVLRFGHNRIWPFVENITFYEVKSFY